MDAKILKRLGLTRLESKTYNLLLDKGVESNAKNISSATGIRLEAIYRILNSLTRKGLVIATGSHPKFYKALPKEIGAKVLLENYQKNAEKIFEGRIKENKWPISIILGRNNYHKVGEKLFKRVQAEVLVIASGTGDLSSDFIKTKFDATKNKVNYKIVATTHDSTNIDKLKNWQKNNFQVRFKSGEGINLVIYDREIIQIGFRIRESSKEKLGLLIKNKSLASFLGEFYDYIWSKAAKV